MRPATAPNREYREENYSKCTEETQRSCHDIAEVLPGAEIEQFLSACVMIELSWQHPYVIFYRLFAELSTIILGLDIW